MPSTGMSMLDLSRRIPLCESNVRYGAALACADLLVLSRTVLLELPVYSVHTDALVWSPQ